jgi:hypothetical protein
MYPLPLLGENISAKTNTQAIIEETFEPSISMRFVPYQRKVCDYFFPEILVFNAGIN